MTGRTDKTTKTLLALIALALWGLLLRPFFTSAAPAQAQEAKPPAAQIGPLATVVTPAPRPGGGGGIGGGGGLGGGASGGPITMITNKLVVGDSLFITYIPNYPKESVVKIKAYRVRETGGGIRLDETEAKDLPR